jgi:asparagine synthase (glutamine-hydrolysing)
MCGIAGLLERGPGVPASELERRAARMAAQLERRGPDAQGTCSDERSGLALSHRRLSILELSPLGAQPMASRSGRYAVTFNGEIYNFMELRGELEQKGHSFRGRSDTEVLLAAVEELGVERALSSFDGMFALGIWDREKRELCLARDRLGEKPLYYGWSGDAFLFGSELKALRAHPGWQGTIDRAALGLYFRYNCIPAPYSVYEGIRKLPAGHWLKIGAATSAGSLPEPKPYWRLETLIEQAKSEPFAGSLEEAVSELERVLSRSVQQRMVSDVPIGAFLSGGIDSSLITALMQRHASEPVRTFTIGFTESDYDEAAHAARIARHLGTRHSEHRLSPADAMAIIPELPGFYDEPFADSSQIATLLVARHARKQVSVCLTGDAGDELFAGYHRHFWGGRIWGALRHVPGVVRDGAASVLGGVPAPVWARMGGMLGKPPGIFADQVRKLISVLPSRDARELYLTLISHARDPGSFVLGANGGEPATLARGGARLPELGSTVADFQYLDTMTYLPDDILTKVDRATMAVSLEARVPFLSPEVLRFAWSLPGSYKLSEGRGKWILRKLLERHLPRDLILRPKSGFAAPIGAWLRGPLRGWAEAALSEQRIRAEGYLEPGHVQRLWTDHQSGQKNRQDELWGVLMFQTWLEAQRERGAPA